MLKTYCPEVEVLAEAETIKESIPLIVNQKPDIVFLDIVLRDGNGFELWDYIPAPDFSVIFTTAHDQYAIKAIRADACDYLLKPIIEKELIAAVNKAQERKRRQSDFHENNIIKIPTMTGFLLCNTDDILYCQAEGRYTIFHFTNGEQQTASKNLGDYEPNLTRAGIIRIHRSYAVNIYKIAKYSKGKSPQVTLQNNTTLNVSPQYKETLLKAIEQR